MYMFTNIYVLLMNVTFSDTVKMTASAEKPSPKKKGGEMKTKVKNNHYCREKIK